MPLGKVTEILYKIANCCYEERYSNSMENSDLERIIKLIFQCFSDIFFQRKDLAIMFFDQLSDFCVMVIENDDLVLMPRAFKCLTSLV